MSVVAECHQVSDGSAHGGYRKYFCVEKPSQSRMIIYRVLRDIGTTGYPCEGQSVKRTGSAQAKNLSSRPPSRWNFQASTKSRRAGMKVAVKVACCANARENQAKPKILLFPCAGTCCSSKCLINYRESRTKSFAESIFVSCLAFKIAIVVVQA